VAKPKATPQLLSPRRRAAGPILSPEHFRSSQRLFGSNITTGTSSSFLTPFLPGPRSMSPPPKHEADDYLNVHGHYNDGKKHHKRKDRKHYNPMEGSEKPRPDQISPVLGPPTMSSAGSDCELCASGGHGSDLDSASESPLVKGSEQLVVRTDTTALAGSMDVDPAQNRTWPRLRTLTGRDDGAESPAVNALRSLSQPQPKISEFESQKLRRMSSALANSFNFLKSKSPTTNSAVTSRSISPKWDLTSGKRSTHKRSLAFRDSDRRRPTFREGKAASGRITPSSIILRKASNGNLATLPESSMNALLSHEDENLRCSEAPASELLAFYSSKTNETSILISSGFPSPGAQETSSDSERRPSKTTCPPSVHFPKARRQSVLAANTLTFTDVHIAPGTFTMDSRSRQQSLAVAKTPPRRISVVQFRSRDSVHEIIWREDETTSGSSLSSSSRTSPSPPRGGQSLRSAEPSPEAEEGQTKEAQSSSMPIVPVPSSMIEQTQVGLFQWSWAKTAALSDAAMQAKERKGSCPDLIQLESASNPDSSRTRRSSNPYAVIESHTRSVSEIQNMQSFPPLRDRSSTLEWQKAPLVDISEPLAGRGEGSGPNPVARIFVQTQAERESVDLGLRKSFSGRRSSSHPYAPARNGLSGRVGSSIGSCSHVRVRNGHKGLSG